MNTIQLIEIKTELGAGTRGASLGIDAIKLASAKKKSNFFSEYPIQIIDVGINQALFEKSEDRIANHIQEIFEIETKICHEIAEIAKSHFPIILGGDHSVGSGTINGIKKAFPDKRIGVVWIDAHADLHTPYTTPTGNMHGMPLSMSLAIDNQEEAINVLNPRQKELWEKIKNIGQPRAKIQAEDLVFIGLRDPELQEQVLIKKHNIQVFSVNDVRKQAPEAIVNQTLNYLNHCDIICVSFDVDSMDPDTVSYGTGTTSPNGITKEEAINLNMGFIKNKKIASWEMVEVNPLLDKGNTMGEVAFEILEKVVTAKIS